MGALEELTETDDDHWEEARCNTGGGELAAVFFSEELHDIARAKTICAECPVLARCLEGAIARREPWGVWGGQLFRNGRILATKRPRGRPPKNPRPEHQLPRCHPGPPPGQGAGGVTDASRAAPAARDEVIRRAHPSAGPDPRFHRRRVEAPGSAGSVRRVPAADRTGGPTTASTMRSQQYRRERHGTHHDHRRRGAAVATTSTRTAPRGGGGCRRGGARRRRGRRLGLGGDGSDDLPEGVGGTIGAPPVVPTSRWPSRAITFPATRSSTSTARRGGSRTSPATSRSW
ncbi:MAG: WhiB family transcriptional regulator [Acidimicrobiia bacterium]|nr:WhiB family transcriptional regulator [Acidimicrobiia bacterium]